jgi:signal transduction histidine kinase
MAGSQITAAPRSAANNQLSRIWLGWFALVLGLLAAWAPFLAAHYRELANPPSTASNALHAAGVSATGDAVYHTALDAMFVAGCIAVAGLVLKKRQSQPLAGFLSFVLPIWGVLNGTASEAALAGPRWGILLALAAWASLACLVREAVLTYRRGPELRPRQQVRWLLYGVAVSAVAMLAVFASLGSPLWLDAGQIDRHMTAHLLQALAGCGLLASLYMGWLAPTVSDPDTLIRRTMVYGTLTAIVAGGTVFLVLLPALLYYELGPVYLLAVVCAWSILGLRLQQAVQRAVNRMLYGQREEPAAVLNELGNRLELGSPETVLGAIVETVATALKLPGVGIRTTDGATLAETGAMALPPVSLVIMHQGEAQGELLASPRARDEGLDEHDMEVLRLVARQAGPTVRSVQLTQELRRSRQEILSGREEERRRIRRDLHDGLGPALAAIAMQVDTARAIVDDEPEAARELLVAVTRQAEDVVAEVRRLVYDLRPPALDQLGLVGAIEQLARQASSPAFRAQVSAPETLPPLTAAREVALYRIVAEALTNAARHSGGSACTVSLAVADGQFSVTIQDNGHGIAPGVARGIGLRSMEDRASEVGGRLSVEPAAERGTQVVASVPLEPPVGSNE